MTVKEIYEILKSIAPEELALSYDNVGLLVGDGESKVSKVLVSLDCTPAAVSVAAEQGAELIISHHPVIFDPLKSVTAGDVVYECLKHGISVLSAHTNLDSANSGVNHHLAKALGLKNVSVITDDENFSFRKGELADEMSADGLARYVKSRLGGVVRYTDGGKMIKTVAVCGGSGGSLLKLAMKNADAFITADVKHNVLIEAAKENFSIFDAGHFHTENVIVEPLTEELKALAPTVSFTAFCGKEIKTV